MADESIEKFKGSWDVEEETLQDLKEKRLELWESF
jgi:hypothetical protein